MQLKLNILFFSLSVFFSVQGLAAEKFLLVKGLVSDEQTGDPVSDYQIKVVEDRLDSVSYLFSKPKFKVWLPANRRIKVYFSKSGYYTKHIFVDASAIPSIAYKKKQIIELNIKMTPEGRAGKRDFSQPIMKAEYFARDNGFKLTDLFSESEKNKPDASYTPPFPAPVDTYSGVQPTSRNQLLTETFNSNKAKNGSLATVVQGILFADMNYCLFNERTNEANVFLDDLKSLDANRWGNIKSFDSPEYGRIVMRTVNREQSVDTLFALGVFVETSRIIFENFTSDSKVLVHLKTLKNVLESYSGNGLDSEQISFINSLQDYVPGISDLESKYTNSLKNRINFEMASDDAFIELKKLNLSLYESLVG